MAPGSGDLEQPWGLGRFVFWREEGEASATGWASHPSMGGLGQELMLRTTPGRTPEKS